MIMRARLCLATALALLVSARGHIAIAEEGPMASAPLPPPLSNGAPQFLAAPVQTQPAGQKPEINRSNPGPPSITFDQSQTQSPPQKSRPPAGKRRAAVVEPKPDALSGKGERRRHAAPHQPASGALAGVGAPPHDRPSELEVGHLSPPENYLPQRAEGAGVAPPEPPRPPAPYYPDYSGGPRLYGYAPNYPYPWRPPDFPMR